MFARAGFRIECYVEVTRERLEGPAYKFVGIRTVKDLQ